MTTLTTTICWNPFILNGRQVTNIIFYNDEGIMFETHRGWFGNGNNVFRTLNVGDVKTRRVTALEKMEKFFLLHKLENMLSVQLDCTEL